jgi:uncharacterized phage-associated protein
MEYDGRAVANFVLDVCSEQRVTVSNLALQKLVYFCHVWTLIEHGRPLIAQRFEAWEYGPVLPYLYREFRTNDRSPIKGRATRMDPTNGSQIVVSYDFDRAVAETLRKVVSFYGRLSPGDLVNLTHAPGGPWYKVWNHSGQINPGMKIDNGEIVSFYSKRVSQFELQ